MFASITASSWCPSSAIRRHYSIPVIALSIRRSIGWMIVSSTHPPSSSTSFHFLTSRRFIIAFQIALELVLLILFFSPLSLLLPLPLSISLSLSLSLGFKGLPGRTTSTFTCTKHKLYILRAPSFFRVLRYIIHHRQSHPVPSSISISICLYLYIDIVHITTTSNIVICIPHPPTNPHMANQPLKVLRFFKFFLCIFLSFCLPVLYLP